VSDAPTALGSAGPFTLIADRPHRAGRGGLGFNGGQLLYLSVAACYSNDLYREAEARGIVLRRVALEVSGAFAGRGSPSEPIEVRLALAGDAPEADLADLVDEVDRIAEIPGSIRGTTSVTIVERRITGAAREGGTAA
jgi:putative redox protein